jgi:hypothetical protein
MAETLTGGCLCGAVRYHAEADETLHYMCHCTDCQRWGGAGYHAAIVVAASALSVTGEPSVYTKGADSGRTVARYFCGACGGHLFTSPWPEATRYSVKAGTLDDQKLFNPRHEIWRQSIVGWIGEAERTCYDQGFTHPVTIGASVADPEDSKG